MLGILIVARGGILLKTVKGAQGGRVHVDAVSAWDLFDNAARRPARGTLSLTQT